MNYLAYERAVLMSVYELKRIELEARFNQIMKERHTIEYKLSFAFYPHLYEWQLSLHKKVNLIFSYRKPQMSQVGVHVVIDVSKLDDYEKTQEYLMVLRRLYIEKIKDIEDKNACRVEAWIES